MFRKTLNIFLILFLLTPASWVDAGARDCGMPLLEAVMAGGHVDAAAACYVRCMGDLPAAADRMSDAPVLASDSMQCCMIASPREMVEMPPALPIDGKKSAPVLVTPRIERSTLLPAQTFVPVSDASSSACAPKLYRLHAAYLI